MKYYIETSYTYPKAQEINALDDQDAMRQVREIHGEDLKEVILVYVEEPEYRSVWM